MAVLDMKHIKKNFGEKEVLQDINLQVHKGEVVSIIGPSGSGKSTLLRCAAFLETIDRGSISYGTKEIVKDLGMDGVQYPDKKDLQLAQQNFGLVFQDFNLFPHYTVLKNITDAPLVIQKRDRQEVMREAKALLEKVGLSERESAYPCELSGGQQQRVAIARALAMKPQILYFDEPTSALDPEITAEILRLLKELAAEHMTMVIVTHEIEFAGAVSDRIVFMDGGMVVEEGMPEEVLEHPQQKRTQAFLKKLSV